MKYKLYMFESIQLSNVFKSYDSSPPPLLPTHQQYNGTKQSRTLLNELESCDDASTPLLQQEYNISGIDVDAFFINVYNYYLDKGYIPAISKRIITLFQYLFLVSILFVIFFQIDYKTILETRRFQFSDITWSFSNMMFISLSTIGALVYIYHSMHFLANMDNVHQFYSRVLNISDEQIESMSWSAVVKQIEESQIKYKFYKRFETLSSLQITHHIMRTDNIILALIHNGVISTHVKLPFFNYYWPYLPKLYVYCINKIIIESVLDYKKILVINMYTQPNILNKINIYCIAIVLFSPFVLVILAMYFVFRYFEDFRQSKQSNIRVRRWSRYSMWILRKPNELYHIFYKRLSLACIYANMYVDNFSHELTTLFARFTAFCCGTLFATFLIASIIDEDVLYIHIYNDKTVLSFMGICGLIISICRSMIKDEYHLLMPEKYIKKVIQYIDYCPTTWKYNLSTTATRNEFTLLFQHRLTYIIEELLSVILVPYILFTKVKYEIPDILDFISKNVQREETLNLGYIYEPKQITQQSIHQDSTILVEMEKNIEEEFVHLIQL